MNRNLVLLLFVGLVLSFSKCSEEEIPNYPIEPYIEFSSIQFIETPDVADADTLKLTFYYRDGDNDLGLDGDIEHLNDPYHPYDFYLENGNGQLQKFAPQVIKNNSIFWASNNIEAITQETAPSDRLVTGSTPKKENYNFLPEYNPGSCLNYQLKTILIPEDTQYLLDGGYEYLGPFGPINGNPFIAIRDTIYQTINENHFNLLVDFETNEDGINWASFDWRELFCSTYDSRLPVLQQNTKIIRAGPFKIIRKNNWEGTIEYNLTSNGFLILFGDKSLRLKVKIKDRQLNESNTIITSIVDWNN